MLSQPFKQVPKYLAYRPRLVASLFCRFSNQNNDNQFKIPQQNDNDGKNQIPPLEKPNIKQTVGKQFEPVNLEEKLLKLERKNRPSSLNIQELRMALLLGGVSLFLFICWQTQPYKDIYGHATINQLINRENYFHSIFLGCLSFQNPGHFTIYFPLMAFSMIQLSHFFKQRHMFYLFASNALISTAVTFYVEKNRGGPSRMITPKCHGGVTSLAFVSALLALNPTYLIFQNRLFPFFIIPATFYMYQWYEFDKGYMNQVCRPAHLSSIIYGLLFGLVFKKFIL